MKLNLRLILASGTFIVTMTAFAPAKDKFTAAEQQQISIETPGLFSRSNMVSIDLSSLGSNDYSFPLPVGKAKLTNGDSQLEISTKKGDAVKAMFEGTVRLSRNISSYGNVIVIRHTNGLETMYSGNAQNMVEVGQEVKAGQTIAIVGGSKGHYSCTFAIMINGGRVNPETILDISSHRLRNQALICEKRGERVNVSVSGAELGRGLTLDPDEVNDPFVNSSTFKLDLAQISQEHWAYPLPGSHVISPYGGRRHHSGVDIKTKPRDEILAAFDGVVTRSGVYFGYGYCIVIRHAYGFETLYGHQCKNFVKVGQKVKAGEVIGLTGRTGRATTEHLHFETYFKGRRFNPALLFDHTNKKLQASVLTLTKGGGIKSGKL
ncbi:MAG: M23 family metallopeptidase [Prevotella sp.]|jgi:murein DD-endopeptidase MepM/ murein hydrolase activator NlpD|nr:M23 family metallopeptidase [Prevotella sp.]MCI1282658.1 M23 family metallopeptidase [Prevotella sp.]